MTNNGLNSWLKVIIVVVIALLGFATAYGMLKGDVRANTAEIEKNKREGCLPARKSEKDIVVILQKLISMDEKICLIEKNVDIIGKDVKHLRAIP